MRTWRAGLLPLVVVAVPFALASCEVDGPDDAAVDGPDPERGQALFAANCAACHGTVGQGTTTGPPLVHEIYEPGHHSDEAFQVAVARGSPAHHWDFGDMPPVGGLDRDDVADITAYVRELQREAGIID